MQPVLQARHSSGFADDAGRRGRSLNVSDTDLAMTPRRITMFDETRAIVVAANKYE
jgi:hypothetical protein